MMRGQYGLAAARLRSEIEAGPPSVELDALLAVAETKGGSYPDALAAYESGRLADAYDREAIEGHADVLRVLGAPGEAAAVRLEQLWTPISAMGELQVFLDRVDDLRADADLPAAMDSATMAIAMAPDRGAPYAQLAEVWMDLGRWDDARSELHVADHLGPRSSYIARASVRLLVHESQLDEASEVARVASVENPNDLTLRALRADVETARGNVEEAMRLSRGKRFQGHAHPQLLLAEIHVLEATRDPALPEAIQRFRAIYTRPVLNALGSLELPASPI